MPFTVFVKKQLNLSTIPWPSVMYRMIKQFQTRRRQMKRNMDENLEMTYFIMRNGHNCMSQIECTPSTILYIWYLD